MPVNGYSTMSSAIRSAENYNKWMLSAYAGYLGNRILEVGIGFGSARNILGNAVDYTGVDLDETAVLNLRKSDPASKYIVADVAGDDFPRVFTGRTFDTVICFNVLEHVENDVVAVSNMMSVLASGGHLLLFVPAFERLYSDLDKLAGHHRRYVIGTLKAVIEQVGSAEIVKIEYFNPVGGIGWWVNSVVGHKSLDGAAVNAQIRFFDKYLVPISRMINGITKSFFGQSIICVVEKTC